MEHSALSVKHISYEVDQVKLIDDVSLEIPKGSFVGIIGPNGSGKSTLLKAICGILPHTGRCILEDVCLETLSVRRMAQLCSYIPQKSGISIDISALDVVLMGFNPQLGILEHPGEAMKREARNVLCQVGLSGMEQMNYLHMSEGQKQLCILARTLVSDSHLLLLDEPESALDFHYRYHILHLLRSWVRRTDHGALVTLHDPMLALNYCDRLLLLSEGKLLGILTPGVDSPEYMEQMLGRIYGPVSLQVCRNRSGKASLVMLQEVQE